MDAFDFLKWKYKKSQFLGFTSKNCDVQKHFSLIQEIDFDEKCLSSITHETKNILNFSIFPPFLSIRKLLYCSTVDKMYDSNARR